MLVRRRVMVLPLTLRVYCQYGPCRLAGSVWQAQPGVPHTVRISRTVPVAVNPVAVIWAARWR